MSTRTYRLSRAAEADLLEIWAYILEQSESVQRADKVVERIILKFAALRIFRKWDVILIGKHPNVFLIACAVNYGACHSLPAEQFRIKWRPFRARSISSR